MNEQKLQWDDLRIVLAIAQEGSLSGAARHLKVSHATVFRRLESLERRLGARLFERGRRGYVPTIAGEDLSSTAARMEAEWLGAQRRIAGQDLQPTGTLRVTTTDALFEGLLAPMFAEFRNAYPEIALDVVISNQLFNLTRREADIAIRPTSFPPDTLVGRRIGRLAQAVYGANALGHQEADTWIGAEEGLGYRVLDRWMNEQGANMACAYRVDSVLGMRAAVRSGAGKAILPCYLADDEPGMARLSDPIEAMATDLWLLTHPDLRGTLRIRLFFDHIAHAVADALSRNASDYQANSR
ncbi:LysR family transcriptional regulator [Modicisalibacter luteus]|uniref:LysR family transcriptional regulator n=1 Tax=Modicisalibacter luteus TaxID=453962 RepID=A0ABV7LWQ3_9GAMM|nr:LysR family transcriptional regulator [Halomonas lutea]GHB06561.1 LysR family transcriptional regulator [Halomonas lutea]